MKNFEEYEIKFVGLEQGKHEFDFHVDNSFFTLFDYKEFHSADVDIRVILDKKSTVMELEFKVSGTVNVDCDVTNIPYNQDLDFSLNLKVKFGDEFNDEDDELLVLPRGAHEMEIQQFVYESVILAVPYKKVHPQVEDGTMESDILDKLDELAPGNRIENKEKTDPRWDKLKKLLNEK